ncbi:hypothetical protein NIES2135_38870 [Leptolyngbya boryana NIES-2135]|jgi:hypothetical protein|uniref:Uncharacterized protein n=1 Tax=Leptolyngbya boryana NIES-2135 TaxID=1973484 RepID=A0A1Z4JJV1_LEPBY|nr:MULTISPECIES: hypothetical protein [Leptolyngbya]BAY57024.1 hypothetical protein NIES2135_38870 [Leptolyngbya boryana NIES-2135]MBD1854495.1 hypothetical protein [Leptolyngbya sp. FACHB-1624]MBN8564954.1 hypothetical protein [Leptolyngbya sp. UWPOB_LEPTO1]ULP28156.1 hypothetical protein MCP04_19355 [Leptolyngbya boryana IU 594]BAS56793.1 hypothetical protein LBWT_27180 [Leptolyngbya boryana IAM M-101]
MPRNKNRIKIKHRPHSSQSHNIHDWQPWQHSTGAKTPEGKAKVAKNLHLSPAYREWRRICTLLELDPKTTFKIDLEIPFTIATRLRGKADFEPFPVRFKCRLSKDRSRILSKSFEQKYYRGSGKYSAAAIDEVTAMLSKIVRAL